MNIFEYIKGTRAYKVVEEYLYQQWLRLDTWAREETAMALSDPDNVPPVDFKRIGSIIVRALPFMRPMMFHIILQLVVGLLLGVLFTVTGAMAGDMWDNKMLVNDKLQPGQALVILVDDTYVQTDFLDEEELAEVEAKGFGGNELTVEQRKTLRNRMLVWFFVGELFFLGMGLFWTYYPAWIWQNVNHYLRVAMVERLEYLSLTFHHSNRSGDAIYRIYQDSSMVVNVLQELVIGPIEDIRNLGIAIAFLLVLAPILALGAVLTFIPMIILTAYATPKIRRLSIANRVANSDLTSRIQESFAAIKIAKANTAEPIFLERFTLDSQKALDAALYIRFGMIVLSLVVAMMATLVVLGLEYLILHWVVHEVTTNVPAILFFWIGYEIWNLAARNQANGRVGQTIGTGRGFVRLWCMLQDLFIGLERAFYFLDLKPSVTNPAKPVPYPDQIESVSWEDVHYRYEDAKPVLTGANLSASKGTITAIVGNTGSGKSSLMSLLLRLYDPDEGRILVNGIDIREFLVEDVRGNCAIAMQKNVLFTGKVASNIAFGQDDISRESIMEAAKIACAHEFIEEMDHGYDTELGDRGSKLSSGQRQRLTIARAVVRDTQILILDEPTASLDARTEHEVLSNLSEWGEGKVVFLITHRLSTIRNADNIAFLEDGQIVETGTHDELMSRPGGHYRTFVEAEEIGIQDDQARA